MNRRQKKARAKRRTQQWTNERILFVLSGNKHHPDYVELRHGDTITFVKVEKDIKNKSKGKK